MRDAKSWDNTRKENAEIWRTLLGSEDVQALIEQAHRDAAHFRRKKVFPKEEPSK